MIDPKQLLHAIDAANGRPLTARELVGRIGAHPSTLTETKRALRAMVAEGTLVKEEKHFRRAGPPPVSPAPSTTPPPPRSRGATPPAARPGKGGDAVGRLTLRPEGYGFVAIRGGATNGDVFLPPNQTMGLLDGDVVRVKIVPGRDGRSAGELLGIVERGRRHVAGTFRRRGAESWVQPVDPTLPPLIVCEPGSTAREGEVVRARISSFPAGREPMRVSVEAVIGAVGDPLVEVLSVAYRHGFAEDFPAEVREQAFTLPDRVLPEDRVGREDLTRLPLVTIDGADARDFDDAVFVERLGRGFRLWVAVADVAHYVRAGTPIDDEARRRGTSVYFPNHVLPMLPERLSNGICSLNPAEDRLCRVVELELDEHGKPRKERVFRAVMHSRARCTYEQVQRLLDGAEVPELSHVAEPLRTAAEAAKKLLAHRLERGALDFDLPEPKIVLDAKLRPVDVKARERLFAHRLIEELMLAANEAVARHFSSRDKPSVFRTHGKPDPAKLERFAGIAAAQGRPFPTTGGISGKTMGAYLRSLEDAPAPTRRALHQMLLRSMMQAVYGHEPLGHFGLAADDYLHFTSPIRRYPDLVVHRLLDEEEAGRVTPAAQLSDVAAQSSERERAAMLAERDIDRYFGCVYFSERVGALVDGFVSSVTDVGARVALEGSGVEGLLPLEALGYHVELDEEVQQLHYGGGVLSLGDEVRVRILRVSAGAREIELGLESASSSADRSAGAAKPATRTPVRRPKSGPPKPYDRRPGAAGKGKGRPPPKGRGRR